MTATNEADVFETVAEADIKPGHTIAIRDVGGEDYRIDIQRPDDGKTLELRLSVTEAEALLQCLMDAVG